MRQLTLALASLSMLCGGNAGNVAETSKSYGGKAYKYRQCNGCDGVQPLEICDEHKTHCKPVESLDCPSDELCPVTQPPSWYYGERIKVRV